MQLKLKTTIVNGTDNYNEQKFEYMGKVLKVKVYWGCAIKFSIYF